MLIPLRVHGEVVRAVELSRPPAGSAERAEDLQRFAIEHITCWFVRRVANVLKSLLRRQEACQSSHESGAALVEALGHDVHPDRNLGSIPACKLHRVLTQETGARLPVEDPTLQS